MTPRPAEQILCATNCTFKTAICEIRNKQEGSKSWRDARRLLVGFPVSKGYQDEWLEIACKTWSAHDEGDLLPVPCIINKCSWYV